VPIEDVSALVTRWQRARNPAEQVRVVTAGARVLRSLTRDDRRVLAQALGEHGATDAATRLASYRGEQLTRGQLTDLATALSTVDRGRLEATAAALADPVERQRLMRAAGGHAAPDTVPPPPPAPTGTPTALPPPDVPPPVVAHDETAPDVEDPAEVEDPAPEVDDATPEVDDPTPEVDVVSEDRERATPHVDGALAAIEDAVSVRTRLAEATALATSPLSSDQLVAVLRRLPDGWQRRTAARRLLGSGSAEDVDAGALLELFGRDSDRLAVAQVLVARGLAHTGTVTDHLERRSSDRVRRRARRASLHR
jgi:hypothetical protein